MIKLTHDGEIQISLLLQPSDTDISDKKLYIAVSDSGVGIP